MAIDSGRIARVVAPLVANNGLSLYDVEIVTEGRARVVRITVAPGAGTEAGQDSGSDGGVDVAALTALTRELDPVVDDLVDGAFQLEVSSPGLERSLRTPDHFVGARGERISVKHATDGATVRLHGLLVDVTADTVELVTDDGTTHRLAIDAISGARTVFEWGPSPRPGKGSKPGGSKQRSDKHRMPKTKEHQS